MSKYSTFDTNGNKLVCYREVHSLHSSRYEALLVTFYAGVLFLASSLRKLQSSQTSHRSIMVSQPVQCTTQSETRDRKSTTILMKMFGGLRSCTGISRRYVVFTQNRRWTIKNHSHNPPIRTMISSEAAKLNSHSIENSTKTYPPRTSS